METPAQNESLESSKSLPQRGKSALGKVAAGLVVGGMVLLGSALQATTAGAAVVAHRSTLRHAQVVALDAVVANRLNVIRQSFGLASGVATTEYSGEVDQAVALNEDRRSHPRPVVWSVRKACGELFPECPAQVPQRHSRS